MIKKKSQLYATLIIFLLLTNGFYLAEYNHNSENVKAENISPLIPEPLAVYGYITFSDGTPAKDIPVTIMTIGGPIDGYTQEVITESNGRYSVAQLTVDGYNQTIETTVDVYGNYGQNSKTYNGSVPSLRIDVQIFGNLPPNSPEAPSGNNSLMINETGTFLTRGTDPDNDSIQYRFNWGNGITSNWTTPGPSNHSHSQSYAWTTAGTYTVKSQSKDEYGLRSKWSNGMSVTVIAPNQPPIANFSYNPIYPATTHVINFTDLSADSDGVIENYSWDFGDGTNSNIQHPTHQYTSAGNYTICLNVTDDDGDSDEFCKIISVISNNPPEKPNVPTGPTNGILNQSYTYSTTSIDPDDNLLYYKFDWGDNNHSDWYGPFLSGEQINLNYSWNQAGSFNIKAKSKDSYGAESEWSNPLLVSIIPPSEIDTNQSTYDRPFLVRHASDGDWGGAQNFTPTVTTITKVELYMKVLGTPDFDLTVELREGSIDGTLLDIIIMTPGEFSSDWAWIELDFEDVSVTSDTDYFVVLNPPPNGITTTFGYGWGYALGDMYDDGSLWFTRTSGSFWLDLPELYEFAFRTYGY